MNNSVVYSSHIPPNFIFQTNSFASNEEGVVFNGSQSIIIVNMFCRHAYIQSVYQTVLIITRALESATIPPGLVIMRGSRAEMESYRSCIIPPLCLHAKPIARKNMAVVTHSQPLMRCTIYMVLNVSEIRLNMYTVSKIRLNLYTVSEIRPNMYTVSEIRLQSVNT